MRALFPIPFPKIKIGSNARFNKLVTSDTFNGVTVFNSPLYAANPVAENNAGIIPNALHFKYGTAYAITPPPPSVKEEGNTNLKTVRGAINSNAQNTPPKTLLKNKLSHTRVFASSQSFLPIASATNGAVTVGKKAAKK
jgi:hypothetical protein